MELWERAFAIKRQEREDNIRLGITIFAGVFFVAALLWRILFPDRVPLTSGLSATGSGGFLIWQAVRYYFPKKK